jgi:hypothetical protein
MAECASARENVVTLPQHSVPLTAAQRKVVADLLPELAVRLNLEGKNSRTISFTVNELQTIQQKAQEAIRHAETGMIRNSLRHIIEATTKAIEESQGIGSIPASERLYQFKITLVESKPPIWRRIQVKNCTLDKFHERIQTAMGWNNSHLHRFEIKGERYGDPENLDDGYDDFDCVDSTITKISEVVPKDGKRIHFLYLYDFGDNWRHEVIFEGCLRAESGQRYPLCVEGERNCPPEDVGGVWGYADFLEALADPSHEEHEEFKQWAGNFNPEEFDAEKLTKLMQRGLPDWKQHE